MEKFEELGSTKGFLGGDFTWPPADWINPVTDEQEKAYAEKAKGDFRRKMQELKEERLKSEATAMGG